MARSAIRGEPWFIALAISVVAPGAVFAGDEVAAAPEPLGTISGFPDWVTAVAFSPDGMTLAAGTYEEVRLIDPSTRALKGTLKTRNGYARGLAFSSDGARLIVGDYQSVSVWDVAAGQRVKKLSSHTGYVTGVTFAGDAVISSSEDGTVRIWDLGSGASIRTVSVGVPVQDVAVSPDGAVFATAGGDTTRSNRSGPVTLWSLQTGEKVADLVEHERAALAVLFSPDGARLASAGLDGKVNLYDVGTRKAVGYYAEHARSVNDVAFLAGGTVLASISGGNAGGLCELRFWRADGTDLAAAEPHEQRITSLAVSPDGRLLALASQDKTVSLWDIGPMLDSTAASVASRMPVEAPRE